MNVASSHLTRYPHRRLCRRPRRTRRAVGLIWFVGVTLPTILFAFALAVDINSMVTAQKEINNLAYAAAVAGAYQFNADPSPQSGMIDAELGPEIALATAQDGVTAGVATSATNIDVEGPVLTSYGSYNDDEITVTIQYQVPNLVVLGYLLGTGSTTSDVLTVSRSAFVCVPGDDTGPTGGYCVTSQYA